MINKKKWMMASMMVILMNACGGSSSNSTKVDSTIIDATAPVFTSSATVNVAENQMKAITLVATDENIVTYSIIGGNSDSFTLNTMTGVVSFLVSPNNDIQDLYSFTAIATDVSGNSANQDVAITIIDIDDIVVNPLKKTGQIKSYNEDGNIDNSIFDDGYYQIGIDSHYSRDDNKEVVVDHITELMWADDANVSSVTKQWLTDDNYAICDANYSSPSCFDTSSNIADSTDDTATEYCTSLNLGGYKDWRLPSIDELLYIVDRSLLNPAMSSYFQHVDTAYYISSTTIVSHENIVWGVKFGNGGNTFIFKNHSYRVRCVRSEE